MGQIPAIGNRIWTHRNPRPSPSARARRRGEIAILARPGGSPGLFWLGGFASDMAGTKAEALDAFAASRGLAMTRFDYSGHGRSAGRFEDGTISRWLEEALAVFDRTRRPADRRRLVDGRLAGAAPRAKRTAPRSEPRRAASPAWC